MNSLQIQDAFEPYYADRKRFPDKHMPTVSAIKEKVQGPQQNLPTRQARHPGRQDDGALTARCPVSSISS